MSYLNAVLGSAASTPPSSSSGQRAIHSFFSPSAGPPPAAPTDGARPGSFAAQQHAPSDPVHTPPARHTDASSRASLDFSRERAAAMDVMGADARMKDVTGARVEQSDATSADQAEADTNHRATDADHRVLSSSTASLSSSASPSASSRPPSSTRAALSPLVRQQNAEASTPARKSRDSDATVPGWEEVRALFAPSSDPGPKGRSSAEKRWRGASGQMRKLSDRNQKRGPPPDGRDQDPSSVIDRLMSDLKISQQRNQQGQERIHELKQQTKELEQQLHASQQETLAAQSYAQGIPDMSNSKHQLELRKHLAGYADKPNAFQSRKDRLHSVQDLIRKMKETVRVQLDKLCQVHVEYFALIKQIELDAVREQQLGEQQAEDVLRKEQAVRVKQRARQEKLERDIKRKSQKDAGVLTAQQLLASFNPLGMLQATAAPTLALPAAASSSFSATNQRALLLPPSRSSQSASDSSPDGSQAEEEEGEIHEPEPDPEGSGDSLGSDDEEWEEDGEDDGEEMKDFIVPDDQLD